MDYGFVYLLMLFIGFLYAAIWIVNNAKNHPPLTKEDYLRRGAPLPDHLRTNRIKISNSVKSAIYKRDNFTCQYCGATDDLHIDHIHPVAFGGGNEMKNLQVLCRDCNLRKGASF